MNDVMLVVLLNQVHLLSRRYELRQGRSNQIN